MLVCITRKTDGAAVSCGGEDVRGHGELSLGHVKCETPVKYACGDVKTTVAVLGLEFRAGIQVEDGEFESHQHVDALRRQETVEDANKVNPGKKEKRV